MRAMPDRSFPEIAELAQWVRAAEDLDEALLTLASALDGAGLAPVHCALVMIDPDGTFRIAGIWAAVPSRFDPGWIINALATEDLRRHAERVLGGHPVRVLLAYEDMGILGDIAREEGVQAFLVASVGGDSGVAAIVVVSSSSQAAVQRIDLSRFQALGAEIGGALIALAPPVPEAS